MVGDVLKKVRNELGITQAKLAFDAGIDRTYVSELETNKRSPTVDMLFRICDGP